MVRKSAVLFSTFISPMSEAAVIDIFGPIAVTEITISSLTSKSRSEASTIIVFSSPGCNIKLLSNVFHLSTPI